jgi:hypothetical protein
MVVQRANQVIATITLPFLCTPAQTCVPHPSMRIWLPHSTQNHTVTTVCHVIAKQLAQSLGSIKVYYQTTKARYLQMHHMGKALTDASSHQFQRIIKEFM